jgi:biotin transport system substrate-specific component
MRLRSLILCALFAALTALGSLIRIPIGALMVLTFQTFFMFLAGLLLEPKYAFLSQVVYAAIGLLGLPVFSQGGGLSYVLAPSFGFVLGFGLCAVLVSLLVRKNLFTLMSGQTCKPAMIAKIALYAIISMLSMYTVGVAYMYFIYRLYLNDPRTVASLAGGMGVFVLADSVKLAAAIPLAAAVIKRLPWAARQDENKAQAECKKGGL